MAVEALEKNKPETDNEPDIAPGVLAGVEVSDEDDLAPKLTTVEKNAIKALVEKASKRDHPARLVEVIQAWEAALFYRGFQFLIPRYGGGWIIPGESTGYGPTMQMDLALLPTNIYSSYAQIIISSLTRAVPNVRWEPQDADSDAEITATDAADKFVKVISRNNDLTMIQTDAARYLWTDGRFLYYTRYMLDGQRFGWENDDENDEIVPETEPSPEQVDALVESLEEQEKEEEQEPVETRKPRGQEIRTAHGKLEVKLTPMMANCLAEVDVLQYETEVSISRAKGMFPHVAEEIKSGSNGISEGEIAKLARLNVKLGMQSTYITSDSIADDCTIQRNWLRPSALMGIEDKAVRDSLIQKCPDGLCATYAGETLCYARNESMDDCWALGQAYSGDGQNRNALGTSLMPLQKRLNNWLDLMNDLFIRCIPKKWFHNKAFDIEAIRQQTNIPGDSGSFKPQPNVQSAQDLVFVEPVITVPQSLPDFIKSYSGELAELISAGYPALAGGDTGTNDTARGIAIQRDQALGRIAPTWHSIQNAEAVAMRQAVRWGAKMRDGSINERIPGGGAIQLEANDLRANILCFPQADENFPETYTQKQQRLMGLLDGSAKNPALQEVFFNPANLMFLKRMVALDDLYIPQVASFEKQLAEIELMLKQGAVPNPQLVEAEQKIQKLKELGAPPAALAPAEAQIAADPNQQISSIPVADYEDHATEAMCCWKFLNGPEGRAAKHNNPNGFKDVELHWQEHVSAAKKQAAENAPAPPQKPVSVSVNYKDVPSQTEADQILAKAGVTPDQKPPEAITPAAHAMLPPPPPQPPLQPKV